MNDLTKLKQDFESLSQLFDELQQEIITFHDKHGKCGGRISSMSQALARASGFLDEARIELEIISEEIA